MILVTGAVGTVGSVVVRQLTDRGFPVRAFVRDPRRARFKLGDDIELALGDFSQRETVQHALDGIDSVFLSCGNGPRQVEFETNVIQEAAAAGVRRIVKLSATIARVGSPLVVADWHGQIEERLTASGIPAVILRPGFYMSNLLASADQVRREGKLSAPAGTARIAMIDPRDVAAVAVTTLTEPGPDGETDVLTGPEAINYAQIAHQLSVVTGRSIEFVTVSDEAARQDMTQAGMPAWLVEHLVELFGMFRAGAAERTTDAVRAMTGRQPLTFAQFARDHVTAFAG